MDCIVRTASCGLHRADCIVRIASCASYGLYRVNCIVRIALCASYGLYRMDCNVWIASCASYGLYRTDCIVRIVSCGLHCPDCIMRIVLWDRIVRIASRSAQLSMGLRCADKRRNVAKEEGSIVRNRNYLCALLYEREGTLYRKPTFSYVNSRNCSVESPRGIRVDCKHIVLRGGYGLWR